MSVNKVILIGNLGADPELRYTANQTPVCSFNIATSKKFAGSNGQLQEQTEWHKIVLWKKNAENASKYLSKGRQVYIEGELQTRKWKDKDGNDRWSTEIVGHVMNFLGGGQQNQNQGHQAHQQNSQQAQQTQQSYDPQQADYKDMPPSDLDSIPF
jgi:single-strand DNA-binding protein